MLGILMLSVFIPHGTAESQNTDPFMLIDFSVNADAAFRRSLFVAAIVVSMYIEYRSLEKCGKKREIVGRKISAGENQIDSLQSAFFKKIPQIRRFHVCQYQNLHDGSLCSG
jgi:hypothetical protein